MSDPYLYEDVHVLKNKLGIKNEQTLDRIEAEQSRANMMLLYEQGFQDFSPNGLREIHRTLFGDIYEWAGQYRIINIEKREKLLAGRSVWYSNDDRIEEDLDEAFGRLGNTRWDGISREQFVHQLTSLFPPIWQVHPFREGNTRTVIMMMTFFVEHHGYFMDHLDQFSEFEHLERILLDAVCDEPIDYSAESLEEPAEIPEKYRKYQKEPYVPEPHYRREE